MAQVPAPDRPDITADREIHIICDNYATHKHPTVVRWLDKHQRFHIHFTPTSASWLNMVERLFRDLTESPSAGEFSARSDTHHGDRGLPRSHNENPKPFIWTATASDILEKVTRGRTALQAVNQ